MDQVRHGQSAGAAEAGRELRGRQPARQLQQRERVAAGFGDDPVGDPLVQRPPDDLTEQLARLGASKALQSQLGEAREHIGGRRRPPREEERHRVCSEAPRDEREHLCRGLIEPLRVVDDAEQRLFGTRLRQQPEDCKTKEEEVWWGP